MHSGSTRPGRCSASTHAHPNSNPLALTPVFPNMEPVTSRHPHDPKTKTLCDTEKNISDKNHSIDIVEAKELICLNRCSLSQIFVGICKCQNKLQSRNSCVIECRYDLLKDKDEKGSIYRKGGEPGFYGRAGCAADLKFKCSLDKKEWREALARTMGVRVRAVAVLALLLALAAGCAGAPHANSHTDKHVRHYLQTFGYLKKGQPEVENLVSGDAAEYYEDDFRIAIKTLQEFGGIPVTGEIDEATKELLSKKRCGRPDREIGYEENAHRKKRFAFQGAKWKHTNLTWSLSSSRRPSLLNPHGTRSVLARALDVWQQASRLTFTEINSEEADIVVSFAKRQHGDAYAFDGRGSILAHAFFPGSGHGGDAHFDDDELWLLHPNSDEEEGTSLFAVAAHEFGHSLGLSHSAVKGALMYPWYQGIQPNFVLPADDRNGIQQMYGPKESSIWGRIPVYPTTTTTTTTTTTQKPYRFYPDWNHHHRPGYNPTTHHWPTKPHHPERPYHPDRRHDSGDEVPRPTKPTTRATTRRPHYPSPRPDYPPHPRPHPTAPPRAPPTRPRAPDHYTPRPLLPSDKPDTCDTNYDAVALIRGELFIFKNRYHWRIGASGQYKNYPSEIKRMWNELPENFTHVDAVYERPDKKIAFFVGKELYLFDSRTLVRGYPKRLVELGLPASLEKLDAAMVWGHNGKTYFYSGTMYWKYDENDGLVEPDYPRDMSMWKGVGYNIDSVFQWKDGKTYFFKGKGFWKFNDLHMRVEHERQFPSASFWMGCAERGSRARFRAPPAPGSTLRSPAPGSTLRSPAPAPGAAPALPRLSALLPLFSTLLLLYAHHVRYVG